MRDVRLTALVQVLESRWRGSRVVVEPYRRAGDPTVRSWVHILGLGERATRNARAFAWTLAEKLYGTDPLPFFLAPAPPDRLRALLARLGRSKSAQGSPGRTPARRGSRHRSRPPRSRPPGRTRKDAPGNDYRGAGRSRLPAR
ncbi:MAG TPA: hypothetical protein VFI25_08875 [Planctomycetota bacterium]|nr:hypothetical protein [Planctomycetota bacterium]